VGWGRQHGQWCWGARTPVSAVEWHVRDRKQQRIVELSLKKPDLRTLRKTSINVGVKTANEKRATDTVEKPRH
jgi:hypothetical protein